MSYSDSLSWILEQLQRIRVKQSDCGLGTYVALLHTQHTLLCVLCRAVRCKRIIKMFENNYNTEVCSEFVATNMF